MMTLVTQRIMDSKDDDDCDIIGKTVAVKLRRLPLHTRVKTEKVLFDVLYQAEIDYLDSTTQNVVREPTMTPFETSANLKQYHSDVMSTSAYNFDPSSFARSMHDTQ